MRAVRLAVALLILSPIFMLAISESSLAPRLSAQVTAQPGPAPLTAPAAPGQPQSFATIGALPALAPAPGTRKAAAPAAQPTLRAFRCTCSAPGNFTQWAGVVSAPSYLLASQAASGQCANFNLNSNAPSPYMPPAVNPLTARPQLATSVFNRNPIVAPPGSTQPIRVFKGQVAGECAHCACN